MKTHLKIGIKREEALDIISMDGILLVLCSYIDNMPYVVAEAAVSSSLWAPPDGHASQAPAAPALSPEQWLKASLMVRLERGWCLPWTQSA